ncbi:hypothetical protein PYCC9005_005542 [Savitreella phatthalungensis]
MKGKRNHLKRTADEARIDDRLHKTDDVRLKKAGSGSRKGTKAWRKNVDVSEVEDGMQRVRDAQIGGGIVGEKPDGQLFKVDVAGDNGIALKERSRGRNQAPLRSDQILALNSAIAPVNNLSHRTSKLGTGIIHKKVKGALPASEIRRLKKIAGRMDQAKAGQTAAASMQNDKVKTFDVWGDGGGDAAEKEKPFAGGWVEPKRTKRAPKTYGKAPENLTHDGDTVAQVLIAEEGQSYNPPIEEWNELLSRKAEEETTREERRGPAKTIKAAQAKDERLSMPLGLLDDDGEEDQVDDADESVERFTAPVVREKKTQQQRNREARIAKRLEFEAANRAAKAERRALQAAVELAKREGSSARVASLLDAHLGAVVRSHDAADDEVASVAETATTLGETRMPLMRKRKFGKHALPQDPLEVQLSDELAESLRTLRPEGNVFKDRFLSLVKRGVVEARIPHTLKRRYALMKREKYSHKYGKY